MKVIKVLVLIICLVGCYKVLSLLEEYNYKNAIERCGSEKNIITNYNNDGDKFYTCKVDR